MLSNSLPYVRPQGQQLLDRLNEPRRFIQVLAGPRQVGKTTLVRQVAANLSVPVRYVSADEPALRGADWLEQQWNAARFDAAASQPVLILDEAQKISGWAETVKRLWDEDTASGMALKVVILGSAPLLVQRGVTESLAGRFEIMRLPHWSFLEMREAFGVGLNEYIYYGGYPGAASLMTDQVRWATYVRDSLIEPTISRDVLLLTRVDKPALLRRLFELACTYSGRILSYTKMLGQLQDAGNATTLAHYLDLLAGAGLVQGLQKFTGDASRRRASSPKLQVLNNALISSQTPHTFEEARADLAWWGRLVESAVGAHLANAQLQHQCELFYWRDGEREVDYVTRFGSSITAIEVKSGPARNHRRGMSAFAARYPGARKLLVGGDGIGLADFLSKPVPDWLR